MFSVKLLLATAIIGMTTSALAAESPNEPPAPLRVCADPGNMPLSNKQGQGFQNKVAEILAKGMGTTLEYYWYPYYGRGLTRATINADVCDVLMDVPSDFDMALVTKPYYKTTFVLAYRHDKHHTVKTLDDPILKKWKIGVLESSPARAALWAHGVMAQNTEVYYVFFDSASNPQDHPGKQVEEVIGGKLDAVEAWGPIAGYYVAKEKAPLDIVPLNMMDSSIPLEAEMSFGVRKTDKALAQRLNAAFAANKDAIKAVLTSYGVPLVKCDDCVISGNLPAHGSYASIFKDSAKALEDHPVSSPAALAATKKQLAAGANPTVELSDAVVGNDPGRVSFLLDRGASPDEVAELESNALQMAARDGHADIVRILLNHGAKVNLADESGWTPLMLAVSRNHADVVKLLLDKHAQVDGFNNEGWSPLSIAITYGSLSDVEQLVSGGANVNAANKAGFTPIMFATAHSAPGVVDLLVQHHANVNAANTAGITALMLAVSEEDEALVRKLLAAGADKAAKDSKGQSALDLARSKGNTNISALLSA